MPGAEGTQARHWTDAAAEGKQKDVIQAKASLSTSLIPLWRLDTVIETMCSSFSIVEEEVAIIVTEIVITNNWIECFDYKTLQQ